MKITINNWSIYSLGDHAIVFALEPTMSENILKKVNQLNAFISNKKMHGILDIIPSYHTITIVYDIFKFISPSEETTKQLILFSNTLINEFENINVAAKESYSKKYDVPVCYDTLYALDIQKMSEQNHISVQEIINIHCASIYDVYSIGFLPGFTYMGIVDEKIKIARHNKPRNEVPAGSVGIAGLQTGIYPSNSPGGWQIIGKTPWKIFDPNPSKLTKFKVGDKVQFYPISKDEFDTLNEYK
jgi:inhibitor of KinA